MMVCYQWTLGSSDRHSSPLVIMPPLEDTLINGFLPSSMMATFSTSNATPTGLLTTSLMTSAPSFVLMPHGMVTSVASQTSSPLPSPTSTSDVLRTTFSRSEFSPLAEISSPPSPAGSFSSDAGPTQGDPQQFDKGTSKFHFNSHMNSHFEHRCPHCDYTSRTEGRLKRHIKDFHIDGNGQPTSAQKTMRNTTPGRPKVYRCKQCEFVATTKVDFWVHARVHIKEDKVLQCPKCPFVTEYKHHLEYHLRNHFGSKPFKCNKCNYSCVNKSMLNSHMKSHTNVYQYRCADCTYATKYCHSLKLHLRKYNHKPATILNSDGSLPIEDTKAQNELYKNRDRVQRTGPRALKRLDMEPPMMSPHENGIPRMPLNGGLIPPMYWPVLNNGMHLPPPLVPVANMITMPTQHDRQQDRQHDRAVGRFPLENQMPSNSAFKCKLCCFNAIDKEGLNKHMLKVHAAENQDLFSAFGISSESLDDDVRQNGDETHGNHTSPRGDDKPNGALDLSKPKEVEQSRHSPSTTPYSRKRRLLEHVDQAARSPLPVPPVASKPEQPEPPLYTSVTQEISTPPRKRSRKGKAFKLDTNVIKMQDDGYTSPAGENDDYERNEDYGYTSESENRAEEDSQKVPDFNEIHENLNRLNQAYADKFAFTDDSKSPFQRLNALTNSIEPNYEHKRRYEEATFKVDALKERNDYVKPESPYKSESPFKPESPSYGVDRVDSSRHGAQNGLLSDDSSSGRDASSPEAHGLPNHGHNINIKGDFFECQYCEIAFRDCVLYTMHMGYHGYKDAFHCNSCGYHGKDKVDFFLHIARIAHV